MGNILVKALVKQISILTFSGVLFTTAYANPDPSSVVAGNVSISQSSNSTVINQASQQAIINWKSFNVSTGESVQFAQPNASSVALNRIDPAQGASQINGALSANGRVILVNGAGIHFGSSAMVNVGGLIASTSDISNANFLSGKYIFDIPSTSGGSIINKGTIIAANNGVVALIGSNVENDGRIEANLGTIVLATGNKFTLDFYGDELINFSVDEAASSGGRIKNRGTLIANGGKILITAKAAAGVLDDVVNMEGVAQARSVSEKNGVIILSSEAGGKVKVAGRLDASGKTAGSRGGKVKVLGKQVHLVSSSHIDVSGDKGGGEILIGGNYQGKGPEQNALLAIVEKGAILNADALTEGNGGKIIVWSDGDTFAHGDFSAKGIENGGLIETSGHYLNVDDINVNTLATNGSAGTWLLDPVNITISNTTSNMTLTGTTWAPTNGSFTSSISATTLQGNLAFSDITITSNGPGSMEGDITISSPIIWGTNKKLTLIAADDIFINNGITMGSAGGGGLTLTAAGDVTQSTSGIIRGGGNLTLSSTNVLLNRLNEYTGNTIITTGTVRFTSGSGPVSNFGGGSASISLGGGAALVYEGISPATVLRPIILTTGGGTLVAAGTSGGTITYSGGVTGTNINLTLDGPGDGSLTSNPINTGTGSVTKNGSGQWTLAAINNSYTGTTTINSGKLVANQIANSGISSSLGAPSLPLNTPIAIAGGTLRIISGSTNRQINLSNGGGTIEAGGNFALSGSISGFNQSLTLSGTGQGDIQSQINLGGANGSLTKTGNSIWLLRNNFNNITRATISGGELRLDSANGISLVNLSGGATLLYTMGGSIFSPITMGAGGGIIRTFSPLTLNADIIGSGNLILESLHSFTNNINARIQTDASNVTIMGFNGSFPSWSFNRANTYTGSTNIQSGGLVISSLGSLASSSITIFSGLHLYKNNALSNTASINLINTPSAQLNLNGFSQTISQLTGGGSNGGNINLGAGTLTVNNTVTNTYAGIISGTGGIVKEGIGVLSLTRSNTYTGPTTVNNGILRVSSDAGLGLAPSSFQANAITFGGGKIEVAGTGGLHANRGITYTVNAPALTTSLVGTVTKEFDNLVTTTNLNANNFIVTGSTGGDSIASFTVTPTAGTYDNKNVGTNKLVTVSDYSVNVRNSTNTHNVFGYKLNSASGAVGVITPAPATNSTSSITAPTFVLNNQLNLNNLILSRQLLTNFRVPTSLANLNNAYKRVVETNYLYLQANPTGRPTTQINSTINNPSGQLSNSNLTNAHASNRSESTSNTPVVNNNPIASNVSSNAKVIQTFDTVLGTNPELPFNQLKLINIPKNDLNVTQCITVPSSTGGVAISCK